MMGSAQQGQVGQVGGAAMEPVAEMVGFAPGRGSVAAGHHTAAVADDQGGALGGRRRPGWSGRPPVVGWGRHPGSGGAGSPPPGASPPGQPSPSEPSWLVGPVAGDQHPGHGTVAGQPPAGLGVQRPGPTGLPTQPIGAEEAVQVHGDQQLGPDPTALGQPAGLEGAAGQLGQGIGAALATRSGCRAAVVGRASGSRAASRVWPASGSNSPLTATMPSQVGDSHSPRR